MTADHSPGWPHPGKRAVCPVCGVVNDDFTAIGDLGYPDAGAVSICLECSGVGVFTGDGLEVRPMTEAEKPEILGDPSVQKARFVAMLTRAARPRK